MESEAEKQQQPAHSWEEEEHEEGEEQQTALLRRPRVRKTPTVNGGNRHVEEEVEEEEEEEEEEEGEEERNGGNGLVEKEDGGNGHAYEEEENGGNGHVEEEEEAENGGSGHVKEENGGTGHLSAEEENKDSNNPNNPPPAAAVANSLQKNHSVYLDSDQGNGSADGISGIKHNGFRSSNRETNSRDEELHVEENNSDNHQILSTKINLDRLKDDSLDEILPCSTLLPVNGVLREAKHTNLEHVDDRTELDADVDLLDDEADQGSTELDVETVLKNQNSHDLYCPNCHSCITRRVVLRRRKKRVQNIPRKSKHDKSEGHSAAAVPADQSDDALIICSNDSPTPAADDENQDRQPDVFRCLSCFSIFMPTGNGFKLFRGSGNDVENREAENVQNMPPSKKNWFLSIFASDKRKPATEQGNRASEHSVAEGINQHALSPSAEKVLPCHGSDPITSFGDKNPVKTTSPAEDSHLKYQQESQTPENSDVSGVDQYPSSSSFKDMPPCNGGDHPVAQLGDMNPTETRALAKDSLIKSLQGGSESLNRLAESLLLEKPPTARDQETSMAMGNKSIEIASQPESFWSVGIVNSAKIEPLENGKGAGSETKPIPLNGVSGDVGEKSDKEMGKQNRGDDVIVIIQTQSAEVMSSHSAPDVDIPVHTRTSPRAEILVVEDRGPETTEARQLDILKSIVYGGLLETITSLGVVTSAAAAGTAALDIFILGLANLMGGLIIVGHNLRELKNDPARETSTNMNEQEDRYQQLLGRKENFSLHATLVVLSFLIFGLMPPVIYGFSFRKSDNRDLKIAAVAGSSLACIILLALGKVRTQKSPRSYMKTVSYYVSIGLMTSGLSYLAGDLLKKLLEKLSAFESSSSLDVPFLYTDSMNTRWASY